MKTRSLRLLTCLFATCLATATASAQHHQPDPSPFPSPSASPTGSPTPTDHTSKGEFRDSDGTTGTFVETFTVADSVTTDTIVYTATDATTSTQTLTITTNTDGTKTAAFSDLGFGATTAFTSTTTYTVGKGGSAVGTGTFTTAAGTTGVLAAVVARNHETSIVSTDFTSSAGVLTRQVVVEQKNFGFDSTEILDVDAAGTLTTKTITRFGGMHHQHP